MIELLQHLIDGLSLGAIYALIALGYTMVYGVLQLINFAHGDVFMLGAMVGYYASAKWTGEAHHPSYWGAALIALLSMVICGFVGFIIERVAYRPLRNAPRINSLITAIGVSFFLEYGGQVLFGPTPNAFGILPHREALNVAGLSIGYVDLIVFAVSIALMLLLQRIVFHTRIGTAMRAVSWNAQVASLMGINTDFVISFTFVLGSVLAAVAGLLYASKYPERAAADGPDAGSESVRRGGAGRHRQRPRARCSAASCSASRSSWSRATGARRGGTRWPSRC